VGADPFVRPHAAEPSVHAPAHTPVEPFAGAFVEPFGERFAEPFGAAAATEPREPSVYARPVRERASAPDAASRSVSASAGSFAERLRGRVGSLELLLVGLFLLLALRFLTSGQIGSAGMQAWETVFVAICVQALPFVVLGTVVSAGVAALVPPGLLERLLPRKASLAVPIAGAAGALLPGCECASIPVASRLMAGGVAPAASLAFLLSAPAINPVVLTATAVAFPGQPQMVWARLLASLLASMVMGWLWVGFGRPEWLRPQLRAHEHHEGGKVRSFLAALEHDFLQSAGFLVVGALMAATLNVLVPRSLLVGVGTVPVLNLLVLGLLAVVLAICSEADAFVAASLTAVSPTARLAFLVVGPMVDVKLISLQAGTFGRGFAWRFSGATFVVALVCAGLVGGWLL
jgi:uncharacterized membrane protein YraQ (UPF0718 family)